MLLSPLFPKAVLGKLMMIVRQTSAYVLLYHMMYYFATYFRIFFKKEQNISNYMYVLHKPSRAAAIHKLTVDKTA